MFLSSSKSKYTVFYGWVVVVAFFVIGITLYGIHFSFGLFFKSIQNEFVLTRTITSAITSVNLLLAGMFSFAAGWILDKYGPKTVVLLMGLFAGLSLLLTSQTHSLWQLFITYSVLLSIGTGALYVVPTSTLSRWFNKKRGLALGIAGSGSGLGILVMAPLATYLISTFEWRMAYILVGLIAWLVVIPLSLLLKKDPLDIGVLPDGIKSHSQYIESEEMSHHPDSLSLLRIIGTRNFWLILFIWLLFAECLFLIIIHLVPHVTDIGFSSSEAAGVVSLMGGSAIAGRVPMGIASDRIGRKVTLFTCTLLMAGAMLWLTLSKDLWMLYLFTLVFGLAYGGFSTSGGALIGNVFGLRNIGAIFGILEIGFGIGAAVGPAIGGIIFDSTNSYTTAFLIGAYSMFSATVIVPFIKIKTIGNT